MYVPTMVCISSKILALISLGLEGIALSIALVSLFLRKRSKVITIASDSTNLLTAGIKARNSFFVMVILMFLISAKKYMRESIDVLNSASEVLEAYAYVSIFIMFLSILGIFIATFKKAHAQPTKMFFKKLWSSSLFSIVFGYLLSFLFATT